MRTESKKVSRRRFLKETSFAVGGASAFALLWRPPLRGAGNQFGVVELLGPPGVGRSEQSRRLAERHSILVISTGDLLRDHVRRGTQLGLQAHSYMKGRQLVPDSLMEPILEERLSQAYCEPGFILDGYSRMLAQAESPDALLKPGGLPPHIFLIEVPTERLLKLLTGRRVCPRCHPDAGSCDDQVLGCSSDWTSCRGLEYRNSLPAILSRARRGGRSEESEMLRCAQHDVDGPTARLC
jgi:adenylate kinase family enzyme